MLSFVEMGRYLLKYPGVKFLFSERFTQDPLESFFGQQQQRGGGSNNPNTLDFMYATSYIQTRKTIGRVSRGNVRGSKQGEDLEKQYDDAPLAKRPRRK